MQHITNSTTSYFRRPNPVHGSSRKLLLLAPAGSAGLRRFQHVQEDRGRFEERLSETQRLRGGVYLRIGAIDAGQLTASGCHKTAMDDESWHLLVLNEANEVSGCLRYCERSNDIGFSQLSLSHSSLALCPRWGSLLRSAVENELLLARNLKLPYVEVGGWALLESLHGTREALRMALVIYALARKLGGAMGITTANNGNCSASILRRIGGHSLEHANGHVPAYYDAQYNRDIEILRFQSWAPNPRYASCIHEIENELQTLPVLTVGAARIPAKPAARAFGAAAGWSHSTVSGADNRC
jgi:hypothetical protein